MARMARAVVLGPLPRGLGDEATALECRRRVQLAVSLWGAALGGLHE